MPKFRNIPQFLSAGYAADIPWEYLESTLSHYQTLQMNPEFQRVHIWTTEQQRAYVEFILRGGTSGKDIFFSQADWSRSFKKPMYLVDGKQRIEAVRTFLNNELSVFGGDTYNKYEDKLPLHATLRFHIATLQTYTEVLQWYIDLNSGVAHSKEELDRVRKILKSESDRKGSI